MNRQLKFRAWGGEYWYPIEDDGDYFLYDNGNGIKLHDKYGRCKSAILCQFTGLTDKNDKEIYEGDVVKAFTNIPFSIIFNKGCFGYVISPDLCPEFIPLGDNQWFEWDENSKSKLVEVTGNIYEHPELLDVKQAINETK